MPDTILVVGDFMIDTGWVVSESSAPTAQAHAEVRPQKRLHPASESCRPGGAGTTCLALRTLFKRDEYEIHGLGVWNRFDDHLWLQMRVWLADFPRKPADHVFKLHHLRVWKQSALVTTKKARYYVQLGEDAPQLMSRYDQDPDEHARPRFRRDPIPATLPPPSSIRAVVVMDFRKGAVQARVLNALRRYIGKRKCHWFVDSKDVKLPALLTHRVDLVSLNREEGARLIGRKSLPDVPPNGLDILEPSEEVFRKLSGKAERIVLKLDHHGTILFQPRTGSKDTFVASRSRDLKAEGVGAGDFLLAQLVLHHLRAFRGPDNEKMINNASAAAAAWLRYSEREFWMLRPIKSDVAVPLTKLGTAHGKYVDLLKEEQQLWKARSLRLQDTLRDMRKSRRYAALKAEGRIDLRDAKGFFGDVVSIDRTFRRDLLDFAAEIERYLARPNPPRPLNCVLVAAPGMGKSLVVREVAKLVKPKCQFGQINVSQMGSARTLLQAIAQWQQPEPPPLVLLDEVDSFVSSSRAYSLLLSPLWDARVWVSDRWVDLPRKIVFVLVLSSLETLSQVERWLRALKKEEKGKDLLSRLNGPRLQLKRGSKTNRIYIATELIRRHHPSTRVVTQEIFDVVYRLRSFNPREVERLVALLEPPVDGILRLGDTGTRLRDIFGPGAPAKPKKEGKEIRIIVGGSAE